MGDLRQEEMPVDFDIDGLALGGNWALRTDRGRVDVMAWVPGIGGYDELTGDSVLIEMREVGVVRVAGYRDVVTMKTAAGRPEDEVDLQRLREACGES